MNHSIHVPGLAYGLRPVGEADAAFILEVRASGERTRYLHPIPPSLEAQVAWIRAYLERPDDYYFVIYRLRDARPEGLVGLYGFEAEGTSAEWGRWIVRAGSLASVESALLIHQVAFETLRLERVHSRTVADNAPVVSFHESCGLSPARILPGFYQLGGQVLDAVDHETTRESWPALRARLSPKAELIARRVNALPNHPIP